jgi:hypothetical protein
VDSGVSNQKDLLNKGKPTRRARVFYVSRELNIDPLTDLLMGDIQALLKLLDLFNWLHKLETKLTDKRLRFILFMNDCWLTHLPQFSSFNFHNYIGGDNAKETRETRITSCCTQRQQRMGRQERGRDT